MAGKHLRIHMPNTRVRVQERAGCVEENGFDLGHAMLGFGAMRWYWLLLVLPNLCLARIVQISDLVKPDKSWPIGTILHETTGHVIASKEVLASSQYRAEVVFRYHFKGVVKEGKRRYVRIVVANLLLEKAVAANRGTQHRSKNSLPRRNLPTRVPTIDLLLPTEDGRLVFPFPLYVVTESKMERVEIAEAVLQISGEQLKVIETADKISPASKLPWLPPREWPSERKTIRLEKPVE